MWSIAILLEHLEVRLLRRRRSRIVIGTTGVVFLSVENPTLSVRVVHRVMRLRVFRLQRKRKIHKNSTKKSLNEVTIILIP